MRLFARTRHQSPRVTAERIAAMHLYSTRSRDALTQRLDVQTKASEPSGRRLAGETQSGGNPE